MSSRLVIDVIAGRTTPWLAPGASALEAARVMKEHASSAVLVVECGELLGVCAERDIIFGVVAEGRDPSRTRVAAIMTRDPQTIGHDKPLAHALHLMYEGRFRHVPVVDGDGRPVGLLCAGDALNVDCIEFEHDLVRREEIAAIL